MLFSPVYIESHLRPFTLSLEGLFSFLLSPVVSFLQPSNLQTFQRSTCLGRRLPQHSNLQPVNISTPLNPNSLPFNPFADPHPLNLYATIFYKNMAREGDAPAPAGSLPTLALSPLAATLMDLSASVANKRLTGQAKLFRCNTYKNPRGGVFFPFWNSKPSNPQSSKVPRVFIYSKLSGSISTSTAVSGISFASQYAIAPPSNFVSTERFGDFSRNWNRCSFFNRASGAVAGPRMRTLSPSCGEKYSESCRDQRMVFSRLTSRTITLASEVYGGYAIILRKCNSRSKNAR